MICDGREETPVRPPEPVRDLAHVAELLQLLSEMRAARPHGAAVLSGFFFHLGDETGPPARPRRRN